MLTDIEKVKLEYGESSELPLLTDDEVQYFLDKNSGSIRLASIDCARVALLKLSQNSDETVSIFSIKGSKAAEQYREALKLFLTNSNLNSTYSNCSGYAAGVSTSDKLLYSNDPDTTIPSFDF